MSKAKNPLVSIVIAAYNSRKTIEKCLKSIKSQTYPNTEILVVDGLNYDKKEREKCKKIIKRYTRYFSDGPERSIQRNRGIKEARGKYILIIDQDMYLTPKVVKESVTTIKAGKYIALLIPEISIGKGFWAKVVALDRYVSNYLETGMNECCRFFKKTDAISVGGYDPKIVGAEDSDFHYKMASRGKIGKIKNVIYHDEGEVKFWQRIKKKYYYSSAFRGYLKRRPAIAVLQFFPIKSAYFKHWDILIRKPIISLGMIILRLCETVAGLLGLFFKRNNYA